MSNPFKSKGGQEEKKGKLGIFGDSPESKPEGEKNKLNIFGSKPQNKPEKQQYLFGNFPKPSGSPFGDNIFAAKETPEPKGNIFSKQNPKEKTNLFTNIELPKEEKKAEPEEKKAEPEEKKMMEDLDLKEEKKEEPKVEQTQVQSSKDVVKVESSQSDAWQNDRQSSENQRKGKKKTMKKKEKRKQVSKDSGKMKEEKDEKQSKIQEEKIKVEQLEREQEVLRKTLDDLEAQIKVSQQELSENKQGMKKKDQLSTLLKTLKQQKTQQKQKKTKLIEQIDGKKLEIIGLEQSIIKIEKQLEHCEELREKVAAVNNGILIAKKKYEQLKEEVYRGDKTHLKQLIEISRQGRRLLEERNSVNAQVERQGWGNQISIDHANYKFENLGEVDEQKPAQKDQQKIEKKQINKDEKIETKFEEKPKKDQEKDHKIEEKPKCEPENKKDEENKINQSKQKIPERSLIKQQPPKNSDKVDKEKIKQEEPASKIQQPIKEEPIQQQKIVENIAPKEKIKTDTNLFKIAAQMDEISNKINQRSISVQSTSQYIMETVIFNRQQISVLKQKAKEYEEQMDKIRDIPDIMEVEKQSIIKSQIIKKGVDQLIQDEQQTDMRYTYLFQIAFDRQLKEKQHREKDRMEIQEAFNQFQLQPKMKVMYEDSVANVRERDPHRLRFLQIFHKYLNQLRILIELSNISNEELMANHFDRNRYIELVSIKTQLFEQNKVQGDISENMFDTEQWTTFMDKIDQVQVQLAPMEDNFDQTYVKGLYRIPQQVLSNTKQQLFEVTLKKQLKQYSEEVDKLKQDGSTMEKELREIKSEKQKLKALIKQKEKKHEILLEKHNKELKRQFFPGMQENNLLNPSEFERQYNVIVTNQTKIIAQFQQLNDDLRVKDLKQQLEGLQKQSINQKQAYELKKRQYYHQVAEMKKLALNSVYLGDPAKVKAHPKVQFLQAQLKQLQLKLAESQKKKSQNQSKISQQSQIRVSLVLQ